jgi:hypothetical protein
MPQKCNEVRDKVIAERELLDALLGGVRNVSQEQNHSIAIGVHCTRAELSLGNDPIEVLFDELGKQTPAIDPARCLLPHRGAPS